MKAWDTSYSAVDVCRRLAGLCTDIISQQFGVVLPKLCHNVLRLEHITLNCITLPASNNVPALQYCLLKVIVSNKNCGPSILFICCLRWRALLFKNMNYVHASDVKLISDPSLF